jgi:septation ring formation regulator EzrA
MLCSRGAVVRRVLIVSLLIITLAAVAYESLLRKAFQTALIKGQGKMV